MENTRIWEEIEIEFWEAAKAEISKIKEIINSNGFESHLNHYTNEAEIIKKLPVLGEEENEEIALVRLYDEKTWRNIVDKTKDAVFIYLLKGIYENSLKDLRLIVSRAEEKL